MNVISEKVQHYFSLIKFSHTVFALPFAITGYFLGLRYSGNAIDWLLLLKVVACMVFARSAAMGFNRYIDRRFDILNARTAGREIPAGLISPAAALVFVIINCSLFIGTTWLINPLCFYLSPVALLVVLGYSYTKRFTWLCHVILGIGLSLAPIGSFLAVTGKFAWLPVLISLAVLFWTGGFDVIYALQDEEFDRDNRLNSIPVWLGKKDALLLATFFHVLTAVFILTAGYTGEFGIWYWIGSSLFLALLIYQHSIVKPTDLSRVNLAFGTTNGVASVVFALFFLLDYFI